MASLSIASHSPIQRLGEDPLDSRSSLMPRRVGLPRRSSPGRSVRMPVAAADSDGGFGFGADSNPSRFALPRRRTIPQAALVHSAVSTVDDGGCGDSALVTKRLDDWMRDSAAEIVGNLREAPLLVQVYANNGGATARLETERAVAAKDWSLVSQRWKQGLAEVPDGLILVEELCGDDDDGDETIEEGHSGTKAWGVVVQGKGQDCGPACYLLKTSRVGSGLGMFCTHFCLVKVQGFMESALSQLTKCWHLE
ncbi:hypothetical protein NMG60_11018302 [Bertholletia excelsa]